jgi:hypothetical protein
MNREGYGKSFAVSFSELSWYRLEKQRKTMKNLKIAYSSQGFNRGVSQMWISPASTVPTRFVADKILSQFNPVHVLTICSLKICLHRCLASFLIIHVATFKFVSAPNFCMYFLHSHPRYIHNPWCNNPITFCFTKKNVYFEAETHHLQGPNLVDNGIWW